MRDRPKKYVSVPEAARELGIGRTSMQQLLDAGKIRYMTPLTSHRKVEWDDLMRYKRERQGAVEIDAGVDKSLEYDFSK